MRSIGGVLLLLVLVALLAAPGAAGVIEEPVAYDTPRIGTTAAHGKVSTDLLALADTRFLLPNQSRGDVVAGLARSGHYARAGQSLRGLGVPSVDLVQVYIRMDPGIGAEAVTPLVHRVSGEDPAAGLIAAWIEPGRVLEIAGVPAVNEVRPVTRPRVRTGSTTSTGDVLLRAAALRNATGLSGASVRVGVISDGVDHWTSARATGDLPANVQVLRNEVGGDEGTAMLEIVHDVAPGASLVFHDCGWNVLEFNQAIDALANAGCRVIVDDIGWIDEPFFEDGVVASHAARVARERGLVYVSAAGNDADLHYQGLYRDDGAGWHDFSTGGSSSRNRLYIDLPPGGSVTAVLQWSEAFGKAASDYDLALYRSADLAVPLVVGSRVQDGDDDPVEVLTWINDGRAPVEAEIDVSKPSSAPDRILEIFVYPQGGTSLHGDNTVAADSIFGHPAAAGVVAVAAIDATDPAGRVQMYSSRGPVTLIGPVAATRQKPDCSGVDGVRVTGAGSFPSTFWGTSAAAPHVAGLAALVWSCRQDAPAAEVRDALLATADDLGASGADTAYGAGRVNATAMHARFAPVSRTPTALPGKIEAEDYDTGGEGLAYHDTTTGNEGGVYRQDDVDIEPLPGQTGYDVGWIRPGEWLQYTVNVSAGGTYAVRVRGASSWGQPSFSLLVDGAPAAMVPVATTGSYKVFGETNATVNLSGGEHRLRLLLSGYCNLDYLAFEAVHVVQQVPGSAAVPRDLDGDGRYEDVNGNGRRDFADVVLYFNQMAWIATNEPPAAFDYNGNGRCDFADVSALFAAL